MTQMHDLYWFSVPYISISVSVYRFKPEVFKLVEFGMKTVNVNVNRFK